jgi:hypothetical protein
LALLIKGLFFALGQIQAVFGVPVAFSNNSANSGDGLFLPENISEMVETAEPVFLAISVICPRIIVFMVVILANGE